jgi:hypothetical protein
MPISQFAVCCALLCILYKIFLYFFNNILVVMSRKRKSSVRTVCAGVLQHASVINGFNIFPTPIRFFSGHKISNFSPLGHLLALRERNLILKHCVYCKWRFIIQNFALRALSRKVTIHKNRVWLHRKSKKLNNNFHSFLNCNAPQSPSSIIWGCTIGQKWPQYLVT